MIYVLRGDETYLLKRTLNKLISDNNGFNVHYFDGDNPDFNYDDFYEACLSLPMFAEKNYVVFRNPGFLTSKKVFEDKRLNDYFQNPPYETDLILYSEDHSFVTSSKLYKLIEKNAQVMEFKALDQKSFRSECVSSIQKFKLKINEQALNMLISASAGKLENFYNYLTLLKLFPEEVDESVIKALVNRNLEDNIFKLINALTEKKLNLAINYLSDLFRTIDSPLIIIASLASQFRYLYQVAYYNDKGHSFNEIKYLSDTKSSYRLEMALKTITKFSKLEILSILAALSKLDDDSKLDDSLDLKQRLELFVVFLVRGKYAIN